jgi:hypothetical protein
MNPYIDYGRLAAVIAQYQMRHFRTAAIERIHNEFAINGGHA